MDKFKAVREAVGRTKNDVIGRTPEEASEMCKAAGLVSRWVRVDGMANMITSDCRMDRIGFVIDNGIVTATQCG